MLALFKVPYVLIIHLIVFVLWDGCFIYGVDYVYIGSVGKHRIYVGIMEIWCLCWSWDFMLNVDVLVILWCCWAHLKLMYMLKLRPRPSVLLYFMYVLIVESYWRCVGSCWTVGSLVCLNFEYMLVDESLLEIYYFFCMVYDL